MKTQGIMVKGSSWGCLSKGHGYGMVHDIYHVAEHSKTNEPYRINFFQVHWFGLDGSHCGGWKAHQLHQIGFFNSEEEHAFSFLDSDEIV